MYINFIQPAQLVYTLPGLAPPLLGTVQGSAHTVCKEIMLARALEDW
jgi:hypothetical protein